MRRLLTASLAAMLLAGCQASRQPDAPGTPQATKPPAPTIRPLGGTSGRVTSVNEALRFVVVDYSLNIMPELGRKVAVYRGDRSVGELKITGPARDAHVVAEIVSGEPHPGDEARVE
jgi:outer membrane biogenesis lipoprotein LolB